MRSPSRVSIIVLAGVAGLGVLAVAVVVAVVLVLPGGSSRSMSGDTRFATPDHPVASPSGDWTAGAVPGPEQDGVATWVPVVRDAGGTEVFRDDEAYSTRHGVGITWLSGADQLWILSSDVGTAKVERGPGGWTKTEIWPQTRGLVPPEIAGLGG